jgi:threonyl-tRNA synthetase
VELSTRNPENPERPMGSEDERKSAENVLIKVLKKKNIAYTEMRDEAAFYGPKIDIKIVDNAGKEWQCATIQLDFNLPNGSI